MPETQFISLARMLCSFAESFDSMPKEPKRSVIRTFIHKIVWDGENVHIYFFGSDENEIDLSDTSDSEPLCMDSK